MRITVLPRQIQATSADALIVNLFEGVTVPGGAAGAVSGGGAGEIGAPAGAAEADDQERVRRHAGRLAPFRRSLATKAHPRFRRTTARWYFGT